MIWGPPAQAKTIGSSYDPPGTFTFSGTGTFFVPDPPGSHCLTLGIGFHAVNGYGDSCTGVLLESASLIANGGVGDTFDLSLPPPTPAANAVTGIVLEPGVSPIVVGFNTMEIPLTCTGPDCGANLFYIQWVSGLGQEEDDYTYGNNEDGWGWSPLGNLHNQVFLYENCDNLSCKPVGTANNVTFTPEPGSLGLLLGALGAGWLARRRKAAA
jgi:hypothetical protein